jgi:hypothetical protein
MATDINFLAPGPDEHMLRLGIGRMDYEIHGETLATSSVGAITLLKPLGPVFFFQSAITDTFGTAGHLAPPSFPSSLH